MSTSLDLFKDADKSDLRLSADLHRTDYPEGVRQSSADSELRLQYRSKRSRTGGVCFYTLRGEHMRALHKSAEFLKTATHPTTTCGQCFKLRLSSLPYNLVVKSEW